MKKVSVTILLLTSFLVISAQEKTVVFQDIEWSSKSDEIYFSYIIVNDDWSDFNPQKWSIARVQIAGGTVKPLFENAYRVTILSEGSKVIFSRDGNLILKDLKLGTTTNITQNEFRDSSPVISPDRRYLAFNSDRDGAFEIFIMDMENQEVQKITSAAPHKAFNPAWSFNGKMITYYLEKGDGKDQIYYFDMETRQHHQVTNDENNNIYPGWTHDNKIIYSGNVKGEQPLLMKVDPINGIINKLDQISGYYPRQSPNGRYLAFIKGRPDRGIWLMDDQGEQKLLVSKDNFLSE